MNDLKIVHSINELTIDKPIALAMGMFDSVHLGHQAVIHSAVQDAHRRNGLAAVLTFSPHPSVLFRPENPTQMIQPDDYKADRMSELGVELLINQEFTREIASIEAVDFISLLKDKLPTLKSLHVGENFRFGKARKGDTNILLDTARRLDVHLFSLERFKYDGEAVSSTRIRADLFAANIRKVNALLGYSYYCIGKVESGKQLGRTIGFPTLNIDWNPQTKPKKGVYAVEVMDPGTPNKAYNAIANYGTKPTVSEEGKIQLEIHLLETCPFSYTDKIRVNWLEFIREEKSFADLESLKEQISKDIAKAKEFFLQLS